MNFLTSLICLSLTTASLAYTENQKLTLNYITGKCTEKLDIEFNGDFTEQWSNTGVLFPDEEKSKKFAYCIESMVDAVEADGMINTQNLVAFLSDSHDVQAMMELIDECNTGEGDTPEDKVYNFYKCFWNNISFEM
ncbi:uncharacterized protein LOC131431634 [Malaya genurostris]|uniref:uncharacterized protein LOC131431634 n=1 Tax=Malaya genurostris TaxID=325434 RepID=UPI0026F3C207|nr:uncharacterized protein LOC131431634 [Malaya genurostris]